MNTLETGRQIIINRRRSGVAFILLDCPGKLNTIGSPVARELKEALQIISADPNVKALVVMSAKHDHFIVGADLYEIRKATTEADLHLLSVVGQQTMNSIASRNIPVIAAINGTCLGGGLEMALSAHWRIASTHPSTILGLPETRLGIIPGLGGTQRLPRLVGLKSALAMILGAETVPAREALEMGLVDELVPPDELMDLAEERAVALAADPTPVKERMAKCAEDFAEEKERNEAARSSTGVKASKWCLLDIQKEKALKLFAMTERSVRIKTRGHYPAQTKVLEVIKTGITDGIAAGLELEAKVFSELAASDVSANLMALFFATDFASQSAASLAAKFSEADTSAISIIGGGVMGASIAALSAAQGIDVRLKVNKGKAAAAQEQFSSHRRGEPAEAAGSETNADNSPGSASADTDTDSTHGSVHCTDEYGDLSDSKLVLENVIEEKAVKLAVLKELEETVDSTCVIASNTSSLPLAELSAGLKHTDRFVGIHFFQPVDKMNLVEIVSLDNTSKKAVARAAGYVSKLGKIPIMVKDGPGFLINRLLTCYLLESARMAEEGIPLNWLDEAAVDFGMPVGPMVVLDEVGMDLAVRIAESLYHAFGKRMALPAVLASLDKLGGKKTGAGIYIWDAGGRRTQQFNPDLVKLEPPVVTSTDKCPENKRKELAERLIFPMIDEAARCLEERIVAKPREIDMAIVHGIGFPPFRGGILKYADSVGLQTVVEKLKAIYALTRAGERHICPLIERYISQGRNFYSLGGNKEEK